MDKGPLTQSYGTWSSPITSKRVAQSEVRLSQIEVSGDFSYWLEGRPREAGRTVLVRRSLDGEIRDLTPQGYSVRSRVHEYGGGAYLPDGATTYWVNDTDQRIYRQRGVDSPQPVTAEGQERGALRYADFRLAAGGGHLVCIQEAHAPNGEVENRLVSVSVEGVKPAKVLHKGRDFYAAPRISMDGEAIAWLAWDHPHMPWDAAELWVGSLNHEGHIDDSRRVAGGEAESIFQPEWGPDGQLYFVSDRTGWWNLYRLNAGEIEAVLQREVEMGSPLWVFGLAHYTFMPDGRLACIYREKGVEGILLLQPNPASIVDLDLRLNSFYPPSLRYDPGNGELLAIGGSPSQTPAIVSIDPETGDHQIIRGGQQEEIPSTFLSTGQDFEFPAAQHRSSFGLFYQPRNPKYKGPAGERPPLLVISHSGPTSHAKAHLQWEIQFWTSRGFAVGEVNYGGSVGYGREYRERLYGEWGVVDVEDCLYAAAHLAEMGKVDPNRMFIRGNSAGGFTTLSALTFSDLFAGGTSYYGVADPIALAEETHKFESHYMDKLIGPYPEARNRYLERSPFHNRDRFSRPVLLLQGQEDRVVPPSQATGLAEALHQGGIPYALVLYEDEGHGFREADTIEHCFDSELYFYQRVLNLEPVEGRASIEIYNLGRPSPPSP